MRQHPSLLPRALRALVALLAVAACLRAAPAHALPMMIRHGYTGCAQCHVDPSGGSALTPYGRAQSEILLRMPYAQRPDDWDPKGIQDFLFGVKLPKALTLQVDIRNIFIPEPSQFRWILMQADARGQVQFGKLRLYGSLGAVNSGAEPIWITSSDTGWNMVSREHWLAFDAAKGVTIRAGRMNLPFGIRSDEHILYSGTTTRTNINDGSQYGVAFAYQSKTLRAELMGIAGNFAVSPDDFRERGYSLYAAYAPARTAEIGVSSLFTHANLDIETLAERSRLANGLFARWAPVDMLVLFGQGYALVDIAPADGTTAVGMTADLTADVEPTQGLHVKAIGQYCDTDFSDADPGDVTEWLALQWFAAPHTQVRLDGLHGTLTCAPGLTPSWMGLVQFHVFL